MAPSQHVAILRFGLTSSGNTHKRIRLFPREQIDIGRDHVQKSLGIEALTISKHHLRFRCIIYDEDNEHDIAPLVYFRVLSFNSVELKRTVAGHNTSVAVSRGHGDILLGTGDELQLTPEIYLQFQYDDAVPLYDELDDLQRAEAQCFDKQFVLSGRLLGVGGQASVFVAIKQKSKRQLACKALPMPKTRQQSYDLENGNLRPRTDQREAELARARQDLAREYAILEKLSHPNIVSLEKVICATHNIYIFQELVTGGDLSSYLDQRAPLPEPEAAAITFQLLQAVDYLHSNGCAHRDIKPENILMTSWREGARIVLTDFGQARDIDGANTDQKNARSLRMQSIVGTYGYTAPEICENMKNGLPQKGYSKVVDIWSVGCVTALLLTGEQIFVQDADDFATSRNPPSESECRERWNVNDIDEMRLWSSVSRKAKSFIKGCLAKEEDQRLTSKQALAHDWFTNKHYAKELAAAYERVISDWQPRQHQGSLIEFINTSKAAKSIQNMQQPSKATAEFTSKHFPALQKPLVLPPPAVKKNVPVMPPRPQPTPLPPMSRDAKDYSLASLQTQDPFFFASPFKPDDSLLGSTYAANANVSSGPLSILQYGPPETQYTQQVQNPFYQRDSVTQSQNMLDGFSVGAFRLCGGQEERVVDSQETQVAVAAAGGVDANGRARKRVCR